MKFDWSEYLNLARRLAGTPEAPGNEAELRTAISRYYYAAFIKARNFLRDRDGLPIKRDRTHQYVIGQFRNSSEKARQKVGDRLLHLRDYRNRADYSDAVAKLVDKSQEALTLFLANYCRAGRFITKAAARPTPELLAYGMAGIEADRP